MAAGVVRWIWEVVEIRHVEERERGIGMGGTRAPYFAFEESGAMVPRSIKAVNLTVPHTLSTCTGQESEV